MSSTNDKEIFDKYFSSENVNNNLHRVKNLNSNGLLDINNDSDPNSEMESDTTDNKNLNIETYGLSGIRNIGNTCYMNSILQCCSALSELRSYLLGKHFLLDLKMKVTKKIYKEHEKKHSQTDFIVKPTVLKETCINTVTYQLYKLLKTMWVKNREVTPRTFKMVIGRLNSEFRGFNQNDSHELLNFVLDRIHEDTCREPKNLKLCKVDDEVYTLLLLKKNMKNTTDEKELEVIKKKYEDYSSTHQRAEFILKSFIYWKRYIKGNYSIITKLFTGLYSSEIKCLCCRQTFITFEPFTTFSVAIPLNNKVKLSECMETFSKPCNLSGENKYNCSKCKRKTDALKTMYIWEPPEILIIHLKRFDNTRHMVMKVDTYVDYPLENFKLDGCYSSFNTHDYKYNLVAVSNHFGSCNGGHYTAYCKNAFNNNWYNFDDRSVTYIPNIDTIVSKSGYILFYRR